jgi:hypothetical protein
MFDSLTGDIKMVFIFILMFIAVLFAWREQRSKAIYCVAFSLALALAYFYHDTSMHLTIHF